MATTKKTKKVETPIDERETFVSLQKTFADSETSTEEKLKTLYELQQADNELDKLVQLRGELPMEVAAIEEEIATFESKTAHLEDVISEYNNAIENYKQQIEEHDAELEKYNSQLENISNSREYDSINKEIENQTLERKISEKNIGEARLRIAEIRDSISSIADKITVLKEDLEAKNAELAVIVESTAAEEEVLNAKRAECASKIDERTMSAYNLIRSSVHNHLAVVSVYNGNACGGCFSTITPQRLIDIASGKKLIICEHCGRIIVATPEKEATE